MKKTFIILLFCTSTVISFAQTDSTKKSDTAAVHHVKSYFAAGISYLTNSVYNGRKDSLTTPYITPTLGYYDKSGFFVDGALSYLSRSGSNRIDLFSMEAGYDYYIGNFEGEVAASKYFYNSKSTNVQSQITANVMATGAYDFTFIKPTIEAGINFSNKSDYLLNFGLEHTFYMANDKFQITPDFTANGSTENYYSSYYNKRRAAGKKKANGIVYDVAAGVQNPSQFKMLDYQFSLPLILIVKKFSFIITPAYVIPVNPAVIITTLTPETGNTKIITRTASETISNTFYCSFGLSYKF